MVREVPLFRRSLIERVGSADNLTVHEMYRELHTLIPTALLKLRCRASLT